MLCQRGIEPGCTRQKPDTCVGEPTKGLISSHVKRAAVRVAESKESVGSSGFL